MVERKNEDQGGSNIVKRSIVLTRGLDQRLGEACKGREGANLSALIRDVLLWGLEPFLSSGSPQTGQATGGYKQPPVQNRELLAVIRDCARRLSVSPEALVERLVEENVSQAILWAKEREKRLSQLKEETSTYHKDGN